MTFRELPRDGNGDVIAEKVRFPIEIDLLRPAMTDARKVRPVALREPTAGDLERCYRHASEATSMVHLQSDLTELAPDKVRCLKALDFRPISEVAAAFL